MAKELENELSSAKEPRPAHARELALALALAFRPEDKDQKGESISRLARALISSHVSGCIQERPLSCRLDSHRLVRGLTERLNQIEKTRLMQEMLDLYLNLAILAWRVQGRLPAREGILLVKEQKQL